MEMWKDIPGYEGIYQASNLGNIRSTPNKVTANARYSTRIWKSRILRPKCSKSCGRGDFRVTLWKGGMRKDHLVARLVAMAWCDGYSPIRHGVSTGLYAKSQKAIKLIAEDGSEELFPSMADASRFIGRKPQYISNVLTHGGKIIGASGAVYSVLR